MKRYSVEIEDLKASDISRWVEYNNGFGAELGRIKSWNKESVFVIYNCKDKKWSECLTMTAVATRPQNLEFVDGKDLV